jgi:hypothetical protein
MGYSNVTQVAVAGGGTSVEQSTPYQDPMDVQVDAIECAGIVLDDASHRDETVTIVRSGNDLVFKDGNNPAGKTLSSLQGSSFYYTINTFNSNSTISVETNLAALNSTSGSFTLNLESSPSIGKLLIIKDVAGYTGTNSVIISGNGKTIDGESTFTFSGDYTSLSIVYTGSNWSII